MNKKNIKELREKIDVIDEIVKEPTGGAHRNPHRAIESVGDEIEKYLIMDHVVVFKQNKIKVKK